jgi:hypothetical protein
MLISNLNYLNEVSSESNDLSGGFGLGNDYSNVQFNENFKLVKDIRSNVYVFGHAATSQSTAYAGGPGTVTQTFTDAYTTPYSSSSSGTSIAATSGFYYHW